MVKRIAQFVRRLKRIWNLPDVVDRDCTIVAKVSPLRTDLDELAISLASLSDKIERDAKITEEICNSLTRQLADLRAVVNNIREESKRGPVSARNIGHLRQFVSSTSEEF